MMISLFVFFITITGLISLILVIVKAITKEETGLIILLQKINIITIKIGSLSAILLLIIGYYFYSGGMLSIEAIGFYVACGTILFNLLKNYKIDSTTVDNITTVISYKMQRAKKSLEEQAAAVKKNERD